MELGMLVMSSCSAYKIRCGLESSRAGEGQMMKREEKRTKERGNFQYSVKGKRNLNKQRDNMTPNSKREGRRETDVVEWPSVGPHYNGKGARRQILTRSNFHI